jgi:hypothetical protein
LGRNGGDRKSAFGGFALLDFALETLSAVRVQGFAPNKARETLSVLLGSGSTASP